MEDWKKLKSIFKSKKTFHEKYILGDVIVLKEEVSLHVCQERKTKVRYNKY